MVIIKTRIVPALGVGTMTDSSLSDYAAQRVSNINLNGATFATLKPSVSEVNDILIAYDKSLALVGKTGTPSDTNTKNENRVALENILIECANAASMLCGKDVSMYLLTGFGMKSKPVRVTALDVPKNLTFKQGSIDGSVNAQFKGVKNAGSYEVWVGASSSNPSEWTMFSSSKGSPILITDLTPLTVCYGRCRAIGARGIKSDWSEVVSFKVM